MHGTKRRIIGRSGWLALLALALGSCETARPKTPPMYAGVASEGLRERGGTTALPFLITETSQDSTYGFTANNPVRVGGGKIAGLRNQQRYLNALLGPRGEALYVVRQGSCCPFTIPEGGVLNEGQLDIYNVKWKGHETPVKLYLNMFEEGPLLAPRGFTSAR